MKPNGLKYKSGCRCWFHRMIEGQHSGRAKAKVATAREIEIQSFDLHVWDEWKAAEKRLKELP